jgi:hypothetical protein
MPTTKTRWITFQTRVNDIPVTFEIDLGREVEGIQPSMTVKVESDLQYTIYPK